MALWENSPPQEIIRSAGVDLVTPRGDPVPPQDVVNRLRDIDPRYSLEWVSGAWGTAYYGLFEQWRENDPRWERVQRGETDRAKARDLQYMFPPECSPAEMAAYVEQRYGHRQVDPRKEADRLMAQAQKMYAQAEEQNVERAVNVSMERHVRESSHDLQVRAGTATPTPMVDVKVDVGPKRLIPKE